MPEQSGPDSPALSTAYNSDKAAKNGRRWLIRLGGTALLLFFLWKLNLDPRKLWDELSSANLLAVAASVLLVFPLIALKAWRWQVILKDMGISLRLGQAYRFYALGMSAGSFTPGQSGDFIKAWHLKELGYSLGEGLVSVVLDRLFDIAALVLLAASGLLVLGADFVSLLPALLALLAGVVAALVALSVPRFRNLMLGFALRVFLRRKLAGDAALNREEAEAEQRLAPVNFVPVFLLTLLASGLVLFRVWLLALALGLNLSFMELVAASSLATVASLLPFSVGGIGARDLALAGILGKLGYATEKAVSLSTFILMLNLVNLVAGFLVWGQRPPQGKEKAGTALSPAGKRE